MRRCLGDHYWGELQRLLEEGVSANAKDGSNPAIVLAAKNGHVEIVKLLQQKGANPEAADGEKDTALLASALHQKKDSVALLLGLGASMAERGRARDEALVEVAWLRARLGDPPEGVP